MTIALCMDVDRRPKAEVSAQFGETPLSPGMQTVCKKDGVNHIRKIHFNVQSNAFKHINKNTKSPTK